MTRKAAFIYSDILSRHILREDHVMQPKRLRYTFELLDAYGAFAFQNSRLVEPRKANRSELKPFHTDDYISAVENLSEGLHEYSASKYNFSDHGDNPIYLGMYDSALLSTGASILAAEMIYNGDVDIAFNPSGGLHHAMPGNASGFCIFNDPVMAIDYLVSKGLKVAYIDIDAHHGDGVEHAYYSTNKVLTISVHESGQFLFPGPGSVNSIGTGSGLGYSVNIPLHPYSNDQIYAMVMSDIILPIIDKFSPDVIATQLGMDPYFKDPITHLGLSTQGHNQLVRSLGSACSKWLAFGGGGYDLGAVARAWTMDYGVMIGEAWDDNVPEKFKGNYGIQRLSDHELPSISEEMSERLEQFTSSTVREVKELVFPIHSI